MRNIIQYINLIQRKDAKTQRYKDDLCFFASLRLCVELCRLLFPLFFLFYFSSLQSNESVTSLQNLTFQQLKNTDTSTLHLQEVVIRGFLYHLDDHFILASEPNLKSCCVGISHLDRPQIIVLGLPFDTELPSTTVVLRGMFKIDANHRYLLENTIIEQESHDSHFLWMLTIGVGCVFAILIIFTFREGSNKAKTEILRKQPRKF